MSLRFLLLAVLALLPTAALGQSTVRVCTDNPSIASCTPVSAATPMPITGTVTATPGNAVGITPTDRTVASATGSSQTMMSANATRHSMTIVNTGTANCGVNPTGGTAVIGGAGTITLAPFGAYTPRVPTLSAVTVICTGSQPIYGDEN